jgi:alanyl-tRNA synthetase
VVVVVGSADEKVAIAVATDESLDASVVVKSLAALVGGGGGGSARLALAGGRDASSIDKVLDSAAKL